jgi:hypothetical protein
LHKFWVCVACWGGQDEVASRTFQLIVVPFYSSTGVSAIALLQTQFKALVAVAVGGGFEVLLIFVHTDILEFIEIFHDDALVLGVFERFSNVANSILPLTTSVASAGFASAPSSEHEVTLGSIPATIVPLNTSTLGLGVALHLALLEALSSSWPSRLMDVVVVAIHAEVLVLLV